MHKGSDNVHLKEDDNLRLAQLIVSKFKVQYTKLQQSNN